MVFDAPGEPLRPAEREIPEAGPGELLLKVRACGICRTDLHLIDGEVEVSDPPRILGHQIVGEVVGQEDRRVGVPWLGWTCGECGYCRTGRENLCELARFTGSDIDGGFAEYAVADERYCFAIPPSYPDVQAAPLLCAGLIGYRSLRMCGDAGRIGLLRLRRGGPYPRPGRRLRGSPHLRLHPGWRRGGPGVRPQPRRRLGGSVRRCTAGAARRGDRLRPRRPARPAGAGGRRPGRDGRLRWHPHE